LRSVVIAAVTAISCLPARAHFQEIIPSTDTYDAGALTLDLIFTHPMDRGPTMDMKKPVRFGVLAGEGQTDLTGSLTEAPHDGKSAWRATFTPAEPGAYTFFVEPQPYWEPAEDKSIIHYAKVVVDAFDWGSDWDRLVGLPVEIEPLTRPYGLWTGNLFSGIVRAKGEPVPYAEVEVEWVNDGSVTPPGAAFVTQIVKADERGVFHYAIPRAGWWGFAALVEADYRLPDPSGADKPVELGGLMWVKAVDMK
jgi:cobalt/nickel transport protein